MPSSDCFDHIANHLKAMADPVRLRILAAIRDEALAVKEIVEELEDVSQPTVSKHLGILRRAGLVVTEREGTLVRYEIRDRRLCDLCDLLHETALNRIENDGRDFGRKFTKGGRRR